MTMKTPKRMLQTVVKPRYFRHFASCRESVRRSN